MTFEEISEMPGLKVTDLLQSSARTNNTVGLFMLADDQKTYELELDLRCAPLVAMAILRHAGELQAKMPEAQAQQAQILTGSAIQLAVMDQGRIGLAVTVEGGSELVISLPPEAVRRVAHDLLELVPATEPLN